MSCCSLGWLLNSINLAHENPSTSMLLDSRQFFGCDF